MPLNNRFINFILITLLWFPYAVNANEISLESIMVQLNPENQIFYDFWSDYIEEATHFSDKQHRIYLQQTSESYLKSITEYSKCIYEKQQSNSYPEDWIFGYKEEIYTADPENVKTIIIYLALSNINLPCEELKKEVIYRETLHKSALRNYIESFILFAENLDIDNELINKKVTSQKNKYQQFLASIDTISFSLIANDEIKQNLYYNLILEKNLLKSDLYKYMRGTFQKSFDMVRAMKDYHLFVKKIKK